MFLSTKSLTVWLGDFLGISTSEVVQPQSFGDPRFLWSFVGNCFSIAC